ncbi:MAG TPA: hypothetical protein VLG27_05120 [Candidatus Saccharimonadia bacterium]|nr:hypothetical protein [Candidatus Saccharimonadia bacterium]
MYAEAGVSGTKILGIYAPHIDNGTFSREVGDNMPEGWKSQMLSSSIEPVLALPKVMALLVCVDLAKNTPSLTLHMEDLVAYASEMGKPQALVVPHFLFNGKKKAALLKQVAEQTSPADGTTPDYLEIDTRAAFSEIQKGTKKVRDWLAKISLKAAS